MRPLSDMLNLAETSPQTNCGDPMIHGIACDSRLVQPGFLFAALPGAKADGRAFIQDALTRGAIAVLAVPGTARQMPGAPVIEVDNPRKILALVSARFYGRQPDTMVAVTGTNGKTSVANFTRQIWARMGLKAASLGTLGVSAPGWESKGSLTTPDTVTLHATLAKLAGQDVTHGCMEASSHGLDQFRLDGVKLKAAGFTNLTRDHLDYHGDMQAYGAAKLRLFSEVLAEDGIAIVNLDSDFAATVIEAARLRGQTILTYGRSGHDIRLIDAIPGPHGQELTLSVMGRETSVTLPLAGTFQIDNALCALGLVIAAGGDAVQATEALAHLEGVPGRLQNVALRANGAPAFVDYAHTPDALETVLKALRPHARGKLGVVFGCGGDRDAGKRPEMGRIAAALADWAIVTDDNPRSEDPASIRSQVMAACPGATEIGDRHHAIAEAVARLHQGDVLVVAGKGHENGQIFVDRVLPFDDADEIRRAIVHLDGEEPA